MKILVTGITGRVGANVARHFLGKGDQVTGFVWPGDRQSEKLAQVGAEIIEGDLRSLQDVTSAAQGQDVILHLGAAFQAGGPFTPEQYFDTNVKGTFNVLEAATGLGDKLSHVIFTSTDATLSKYTPTGWDIPLKEDTVEQGTTDWYGYSKILGEHLLKRYAKHHNLKATAIRFSNVWGAGEVLDYNQFHLQFFVKQFEKRTDPEGKATYHELRALDDGGTRLVIACDKNGRPWKKHSMEVRDIVHAYDKAVGNPNTFGKVYQIASKEPFTWDEVIPYMADKLGVPYSRVNLPMTPTYYEYDLTAARKDFGFNPQNTIRDMIDEAIRYRKQGSDAIIPTKVK